MRPGWFQIAVRFHVSFSLIVEFFPFKFFVVFCRLVAYSVQQVSKNMCFFLFLALLLSSINNYLFFMKFVSKNLKLVKSRLRLI